MPQAFTRPAPEPDTPSITSPIILPELTDLLHMKVGDRRFVSVDETDADNVDEARSLLHKRLRALIQNTRGLRKTVYTKKGRRRIWTYPPERACRTFTLDWVDQDSLSSDYWLSELSGPGYVLARVEDRPVEEIRA